jgi:hypothetical protein
MPIIVNKIVYKFDDKRVTVVFHEPYFFKNLLLFSLIKIFQHYIRPFDSENLLIMLPYSPENKAKVTPSDKMILVKFIKVGVFTLFGIAIYLRSYGVLPFYHLLINNNNK